MAILSYGQVGWRSASVTPTAASTLWTSVYGVWNAENNANDSFGSNNGTLVNGTTFTTGKIGQAFNFDGVNDFVALPNNSLNFTGDFSVSLWMNLGNITNTHYVLSNYSSGGTYGYGWSINMSPNISAGNRSIVFDLRNGNSIGSVFSPQTINTNTWYHVVAVRQVGQPLKIYWNGTLTSATYYAGNSSNIPTYPGTQECNIGKISTAYTNGKLDGVSIWNRVLLSNEITELYNSGTGKQYPN